MNVYTRSGKYKETVGGKTYTRYSYRFEKSQLVKSASINTATVKGLKAKTKYYVTVSPYKATAGTTKYMTSKYNSKNEYTGQRVVTGAYATTMHGYASDYKAGKTK